MSTQKHSKELAAAIQERTALERMLFAQEARDDLVRLAQFTMPDHSRPDEPGATLYSAQAHHYLLRDVFQRIMDGTLLKVIISLPPQSGKSRLAKTFLAKHVGKFPWKHVIFGTYNQSFAEENGGDVRNIFNSSEYKLVYPKIALAKGSKAKDHMMVDGYDGKLAFSGRGGSVSGRPADGVLFDDFFKNSQEASSITVRDEVWNFLTRVVFPRCHVHAWQIIISTRWSHDDPIARLTDPSNSYYVKEVADQWLVINIPARMDNEHIAEALGKKVGDALWPDRFPLQHLRTMELMDPLGFNALYMGKPSPPEGAFFKRDQIAGYKLDDLPADGTHYGSGDFALSESSGADKTCFGTWRIDSTDTAYLLPDIYWDRKSSDKWVEAMIDAAFRHKWLTFFGEKGQIERGVGPFLQKRMMERAADGTGSYFHIQSFAATGGKAQMAHSIRDHMAQGKVRFPKFAAWWPAFEELLLKFSEVGDNAEDDNVDMISLFGRGMMSQMRGRPGEGDKVHIPRAGSPAWFKWCRDHDKAKQAKLKSVNGW